MNIFFEYATLYVADGAFLRERAVYEVIADDFGSTQGSSSGRAMLSHAYVNQSTRVANEMKYEIPLASFELRRQNP